MLSLTCEITSIEFLFVGKLKFRQGFKIGGGGTQTLIYTAAFLCSIYLFSYKQSQMNRTITNFGSELCVKLSTDQWVVGKQVDEREVYIVVTTKNSNLIEIMAEVDKLISKEFRNICLLEK